MSDIDLKELEEFVKASINAPLNLNHDDYEKCWNTGEYEDYNCYDCPHNYECSGFEG